MLRLEVVLYLLGSLFLAWIGGWFLVREYVVSLVLTCAWWSALTVWLLVRGIRSTFQRDSVEAAAAETGTEVF